jgi:hypothetical protein
MGRVAAFDFLVNGGLVSVDGNVGGRRIFGDFLHTETFADSAVTLLESGMVVFDDARNLLLRCN